MGGEGGRAGGREQGGGEEKMHFLKFILGKIYCEYRKTSKTLKLWRAINSSGRILSYLGGGGGSMKPF